MEGNAMNPYKRQSCYATGTRYDTSKAVKISNIEVPGYSSVTMSMAGNISFLYPNSIVQAKINYHRGGTHCTVDYTDPTEPWLHESFGEYTIYHKTRVTLNEAVEVWRGLEALITNPNNHEILLESFSEYITGASVMDEETTKAYRVWEATQ